MTWQMPKKSLHLKKRRISLTWPWNTWVATRDYRNIFLNTMFILHFHLVDNYAEAEMHCTSNGMQVMLDYLLSNFQPLFACNCSRQRSNGQYCTPSRKLRENSNKLLKNSFIFSNMLNSELKYLINEKKMCENKKCKQIIVLCPYNFTRKKNNQKLTFPNSKIPRKWFRFKRLALLTILKELLLTFW